MHLLRRKLDFKNSQDGYHCVSEILQQLSAVVKRTLFNHHCLPLWMTLMSLCMGLSSMVIVCVALQSWHLWCHSVWATQRGGTDLPCFPYSPLPSSHSLMLQKYRLRITQTCALNSFCCKMEFFFPSLNSNLTSVMKRTPRSPVGSELWCGPSLRGLQSKNCTDIIEVSLWKQSLAVIFVFQLFCH